MDDGTLRSEAPILNDEDIEERKGWFYYFDKNNNGKLEVDELHKCCSAMLWDISVEDLKLEMKKINQDDRDFLDMDGYMKLLESLRIDPEQERLELMEAFRIFDRDKSGYMDATELRKFLMTRDIGFTSDTDPALIALMNQAAKSEDENKGQTKGRFQNKIKINDFVDMMMDKPNLQVLQAQRTYGFKK